MQQETREKKQEEFEEKARQWGLSENHLFARRFFSRLAELDAIGDQVTEHEHDIIALKSDVSLIMKKY